MAFPDFFERLPGITVHDPLAELLGSASEGFIEYRFADAVKLTGHACPTVAASWRMTVDALHALYDLAIPERGAIEVSFPEAQETGVTGVMASVVTLITGAAASGGFKGLAGRYGRRNLLGFDVAEIGGIRFRRQDSGKTVECAINLSRIPAHPQLGTWLSAILDDTATCTTRQNFVGAWQARVQEILSTPTSPIDIKHIHIPD